MTCEDLTFIPTEDLIREIGSRCPSYVFVTEQLPNDPEHGTFYHKGSPEMNLWLLRMAEERIVRAGLAGFTGDWDTDD